MKCGGQALPRLEAVVRDVLLGPIFPGVFFGGRVIEFLDTLFMQHDFTVATLLRGFQVASLLKLGHLSLSGQPARLFFLCMFGPN